MANEKAFYRRKGEKIDYTCTGAVAVGDVVQVGTIFGVAEAAGAVGDVIALTTVGVVELTAAGAITQGAAVYLSSGKVTSTQPSGATAVGVAWSAASAAGEPVLVKINA